MAELGLSKKTHEQVYAKRKAAMLNAVQKLEDKRDSAQQEYAAMRTKLSELDGAIRAAQSKVDSFKVFCA